MTISKHDLTGRLESWLDDFLGKKYPDYNIEILVDPGTLSKSSNEKLKKISNISFLEFEPDILGILEDKTTKEIELVFLNRETKAYGIREIGEMWCFCRLAKPKLAMMASLRGLSPAVDKMINHEKKYDILSYGSNKIKIFRWDEDTNSPDELTITPINERSFFE